MASCIIICAGGFTGLIEPVRPGDFLLAADGGLTHCEAFGLSPDGILGDFDSLGYVPERAERFPVEKDDTDSMLAIRHGLELGFRRFVLYGALDGPRLDHTLANLQALVYLAEHGGSGYLVGQSCIAAVVKNGTLRFSKEARGILSVFCMGQDAAGVTLTGLQYPLNDAVLTAGFPLGVSNHFLGREAAVTVREGTLLVLYDRENGFPQREDGV